MRHPFYLVFLLLTLLHLYTNIVSAAPARRSKSLRCGAHNLTPGEYWIESPPSMKQFKKAYNCQFSLMSPKNLISITCSHFSSSSRWCRKSYLQIHVWKYCGHNKLKVANRRGHLKIVAFSRGHPQKIEFSCQILVSPERVAVSTTSIPVTLQQHEYRIVANCNTAVITALTQAPTTAVSESTISSTVPTTSPTTVPETTAAPSLTIVPATSTLETTVSSIAAPSPTTAPETTAAPTSSIVPATSTLETTVSSTAAPSSTTAPETTAAPTSTIVPAMPTCETTVSSTAAPSSTTAPETTAAPTSSTIPAIPTCETTVSSTAAPSSTTVPETTAAPTSTTIPAIPTCETTVSSTATLSSTAVPDTTTAKTTTPPCQPQPPAPVKCGMANDRKTRIIGGEEAKRNEFPWLAAVVDTGKSVPRCTATILNSLYVISYSACIVTDVNAIEILIHKHSTSIDDQQKRLKVERTVMLPKTLARLAKLRTPIEFPTDNSVAPVCLPSGDRTDYGGEQGIVASWGFTDASFKARPDVLMKLTVTLESDTECDVYYDATKWLCSKLEDKKGVCEDLGAPLITKAKDDTYSVIGIASISSCGKGKDLYYKISYLLPRIREAIADGEFCTNQ